MSRGFLVSLGVAFFLAYFSLALTLPVISLHVNTSLGYAGWLGGLAAGAVFFSTIVTRTRAGSLADRAGARQCAMRGLVVFLLASLVCLVSAWEALPPSVALALLLAGRLLLGLGESLLSVGLGVWALAALGPAHSGKIMVVMGTAIYGAYAVGGPCGMVLYGSFGFFGVSLAAMVLPFLLSPILNRLGAAPAGGKGRGTSPAREIVPLIWKHGTIVALQGVGFAVIGTFTSLYFLAREWPLAGWAITCFGIAFIAVRLVFGSLPDRLGGIPVTLCSLSLEATGLLLLWLAPTVWIALLGTFLTGLGCSLVYPSMGKEALLRVPDRIRGTTYGVYAACQDVSYALTGPVAGLVADSYGYTTVFLFGSAAVGAAILLTMSLRPGSSSKASSSQQCRLGS